MLLNKDKFKRIKPSEIVNHLWFSDTKFNDIAKLKTKPPFIPKIISLEDCSNIDPIFLKEEVVSPVKNKKMFVSDQSKINIHLFF